MFVRRVRVGVSNVPGTDANQQRGPLLVFPPRTPITVVGIERAEQSVSGNLQYWALSFGPSGARMPVQSGDAYAGRGICDDGIYAWYILPFTGFGFVDVVGLDRPLRLGQQPLTQVRIPGFSFAPGYPFE